ncbi:unnamed protein product [Cuscuta epithymum]|nr:unnamed protein product [Cuscuta epithymum]
MFFILK